jgi:flagellar basal body P-ring protein FlgI
MKAFFLEAHRIFWSLIVLISFLSNAALSQSVGQIDLKDGTVIRGQIVEFEYPSHVIWSKLEIQLHTFEWKDIQRVNFDNRAVAPVYSYCR